MHHIFIQSFFLLLLLSACSKNDSLKNNSQVSKSLPPLKDSVKVENSENNPGDKIEIKTFITNKGWGYDIFINGKKSVHQPNIPAVNGNDGFKTEENARKTAALAEKKIKNNIFPPTIEVSELDSMGVLK